MNITVVKVFRPIPVESFRRLESTFTIGKNCKEITYSNEGLIKIKTMKNEMVGVGIGNVEFFRFSEGPTATDKPKPIRKAKEQPKVAVNESPDWL